MKEWQAYPLFATVRFTPIDAFPIGGSARNGPAIVGAAALALPAVFLLG